MSKHKSRRRKNSKLKQLVILFILALILGGGYYYIKQNENNHYKPSLYNDSDEEYIEVDIQDSVKYQAVVIYKNNIDINEIAKTFYKSSIFWPYIFIENKDVIINPLNIESDLLIKIPRLSDSLIDLSNTASIERAKFLSDSILEQVN